MNLVPRSDIQRKKDSKKSLTVFVGRKSYSVRLNSLHANPVKNYAHKISAPQILSNIKLISAELPDACFVELKKPTLGEEISDSCICYVSPSAALSSTKFGEGACGNAMMRGNSQGRNVYENLPRTIASDPNDINRINRAGELFIRYNQCPPLRKFERRFSLTIRSVEDFDQLLNSVTAALSMIPMIAGGAIQSMLCINVHDITQVIAGSLSGLLNSTSINDKIAQEWHSPLITPDGSVSWLKYSMSTEMTTRKSCFSSTKTGELFVTNYSFSFPTLDDFNHALQHVENEYQK